MDGQETRLVLISTRLFLRVEHVVYAVLGVLLSAAAFIALAGAAIVLWHGLGDWTGTSAIFTIIDRLLFVLLLIEILHTVRASIRSGGLSSEPFLVVGIIASIRRVLVITLQTSEATKPGNWTPDNQSLVRESMVELGVLAVLILILVVALVLLRRFRPADGTDEAH
jgi:uncharacterized membrane protein (DUF373 family)